MVHKLAYRFIHRFIQDQTRFIIHEIFYKPSMLFSLPIPSLFAQFRVIVSSIFSALVASRIHFFFHKKEKKSILDLLPYRFCVIQFSPVHILSIL